MFLSLCLYLKNIEKVFFFLGSIIPLSAEHGDGVTDLIDVMMPMIDKHDETQKEQEQEETAIGTQSKII